MCRTGGRRCPSSRTAASGGTRHHHPTPPASGGTPPGGGTPPPSDDSAAPPPRVRNVITGNATVGGQYDEIRGDVTITPAGITIGGRAVPPGPGAAADVADQVRRARDAADRARRTARDTTASGPEASAVVQTGPVNVISGDQSAVIQAGRILGRITRHDDSGDTQ
jgi:hypothetical protein